MTGLPPVSETLATTPIHKFMTSKVIEAKTSTTILQAMEMMIDNRISGLPVVDFDGKLVGMYSEMDAILQAAAKPLSTPIECPSPKLITCYPDTVFKEALVLIIKNRLKRLPVINVDRQVVGWLTRFDLMKAYVADHHKGSPSARHFTSSSAKGKKK